MSTPSKLELPQVALAFMNEDHAHAATQLEAMAAALDDAPNQPGRLAAACRDFLQHSREHFAREEEAMQAAGFPPYPVHKSEHDQVLGLLEQLVEAVEAGRVDEATRTTITRGIPDWLVRHVQSMDMVTARWITSRGA